MEEYKLSEIENHEVSILGNVRNMKFNRTLTLRYNADGYNIELHKQQ